VNRQFEDRRPWFTLYVTGRADLIPAGPWVYSPFTDRILERDHARPLIRYLDDVLWKKKGTHRVAVYCRADDTGVDHLVRAYAKVRFGMYHLATVERDRDLRQLASSHALVWYGPRENPSETGRPDPVTIAAALGIEYRVVPFKAGQLGNEWDEELASIAHEGEHATA
jgi:hypothetical protein